MKQRKGTQEAAATADKDSTARRNQKDGQTVKMLEEAEEIKEAEEVLWRAQDDSEEMEGEYEDSREGVEGDSYATVAMERPTSSLTMEIAHQERISGMEFQQYHNLEGHWAVNVLCPDLPPPQPQDMFVVGYVAHRLLAIKYPLQETGPTALPEGFVRATLHLAPTGSKALGFFEGISTSVCSQSGHHMLGVSKEQRKAGLRALRVLLHACGVALVTPNAAVAACVAAYVDEILNKQLPSKSPSPPGSPPPRAKGGRKAGAKADRRRVAGEGAGDDISGALGSGEKREDPSPAQLRKIAQDVLSKMDEALNDEQLVKTKTELPLKRSKSSIVLRHKGSKASRVTKSFYRGNLPIQMLDKTVQVPEDLEVEGPWRPPETKGPSRRALLGERAVLTLAEGSAVDEETMVDALMEYLWLVRGLDPEKERERREEELEAKKKQRFLDSTASHKGDLSVPSNCLGAHTGPVEQVTEREVEQDKEDIRGSAATLPRGGWVLLDFPATWTQAQVLEGRLTGRRMPDQVLWDSRWLHSGSSPEYERELRSFQEIEILSPDRLPDSSYSSYSSRCQQQVIEDCLCDSRIVPNPIPLPPSRQPFTTGLTATVDLREEATEQFQLGSPVQWSVMIATSSLSSRDSKSKSRRSHARFKQHLKGRSSRKTASDIRGSASTAEVQEARLRSLYHAEQILTTFPRDPDIPFADCKWDINFVKAIARAIVGEGEQASSLNRVPQCSQNSSITDASLQTLSTVRSRSYQDKEVDNDENMVEEESGQEKKLARKTSSTLFSVTAIKEAEQILAAVTDVSQKDSKSRKELRKSPKNKNTSFEKLEMQEMSEQENEEDEGDEETTPATEVPVASPVKEESIEQQTMLAPEPPSSAEDIPEEASVEENAPVPVPEPEPEPGDADWEYVDMPLEDDKTSVELATAWEGAESKYLKSLRELFLVLRSRRLSVATHAESARLAVRRALARPDSFKRRLLQRFQRRFDALAFAPARANGPRRRCAAPCAAGQRACSNKRLEVSPDRNGKLREELICRVNELQHALWNSCDFRKQWAEDERRSRALDGALAADLCQVANAYAAMTQAEAERSGATLRILEDYYSSTLRAACADDHLKELASAAPSPPFPKRVFPRIPLGPQWPQPRPEPDPPEGAEAPQTEGPPSGDAVCAALAALLCERRVLQEEGKGEGEDGEVLMRRLPLTSFAATTASLGLAHARALAARAARQMQSAANLFPLRKRPAVSALPVELRVGVSFCERNQEPGTYACQQLYSKTPECTVHKKTADTMAQTSNDGRGDYEGRPEQKCTEGGSDYAVAVEAALECVLSPSLASLKARETVAVEGVTLDGERAGEALAAGAVAAAVRGALAGLRTTVEGERARRTFQEWTCAVGQEIQRLCFRLLLIRARAFKDISSLFLKVKKIFDKLHDNIGSQYIREVAAADAAAVLLRRAAKDKRPLRARLWLEGSLLQTDPDGHLLFPPPASAVDDILTDDDDAHSAYHFTVHQVDLLSKQLLPLSPEGPIWRRALTLVLEDLALGPNEDGTTDDDREVLPSGWKLLEPAGFDAVVERLLGPAEVVDWRDLAVRALELRWPDVDELLEARALFLRRDPNRTETVSFDAFRRVTLWFERPTPDTNSQQATGKAALSAAISTVSGAMSEVASSRLFTASEMRKSTSSQRSLRSENLFVNWADGDFDSHIDSEVFRSSSVRSVEMLPRPPPNSIVNITDDEELQLPPHLPDAQRQRAALAKRQLFALFQTDGDAACYSHMLLHFCKADDPLEGFVKALALCTGRRVVREEADLAQLMEDPGEDDEECVRAYRLLRRQERRRQRQSAYDAAASAFSSLVRKVENALENINANEEGEDEWDEEVFLQKYFEEYEDEGEGEDEKYSDMYMPIKKILCLIMDQKAVKGEDEDDLSYSSGSEDDPDDMSVEARLRRERQRPCKAPWLRTVPVEALAAVLRAAGPEIDGAPSPPPAAMDGAYADCGGCPMHLARRLYVDLQGAEGPGVHAPWAVPASALIGHPVVRELVADRTRLFASESPARLVRDEVERAAESRKRQARARSLPVAEDTTRVRRHPPARSPNHSASGSPS